MYCGGTPFNTYHTMHFNAKNIVGTRFGKLLVKEFAFIKHKRYHWKCKCDCNNECIKEGSLLRRGGVRSCGCLPTGKQKDLDRVDVILKNQYASKIRKSSTQRRIKNELSYVDWKHIIFQPCYYCGIPNSLKLLDNHGGNKLLTNVTVECNGIDRVNSNKGYSVENCVSCCTFCNFAKNNLSQKDFYNNVKRLYENLKLKGNYETTK